jgi:O-acetyl-ADP-ribose deacetylase (regulator of RNase III)
MVELHYVTGDATDPIGSGRKIIAHIVNDQGGWGRGFVLALSACWLKPEQMYREWHQEHEAGADVGFALGNVQFVQVIPGDAGITVANMAAQRGYASPSVPRAVSYRALRGCLDKVGAYAACAGESVHMPRIGTGLGGGDWGVIEEAILASLIDVYGVETYVYDLPIAETA